MLNLECSLTDREAQSSEMWQQHSNLFTMKRNVQMNIAQGLEHVVKVAGNQRALSCGESEYIWSQFAYRTDCLAHGLAHLVARVVQAPMYQTKPPRTCCYFSYWSGVPMGIEMYVREHRAIFFSDQR